MSSQPELKAPAATRPIEDLQQAVSARHIFVATAV